MSNPKINALNNVGISTAGLTDAQVEAAYLHACRTGVLTPVPPAEDDRYGSYNNLVPPVSEWEVGTSNVPEPEPAIYQELVPSFGTKLVCAQCGREDWHKLILRRKRGLIEGLCKQEDGSGCYPNASRVLCRWADAEQVPCPQLATREIMDLEGRKITESCDDHLGCMLPKGGVGFVVYDLED